MSGLSNELEEFLSEEDIEVAKQALLARRATSRHKIGVTKLPLPPGATRIVKEMFQHFETFYDNMDWAMLTSAVQQAREMQPSIPQQLLARTLLASAMDAKDGDAALIYMHAVDLVAEDLENADLYLAMAVCKLSSRNISDCEALLDLVELCPAPHKNAVQMVREKMHWMKDSHAKLVHEATRNLQFPGFIEKIMADAELEEASDQIRDEMKGFLSMPFLHRLKTLYEPAPTFISLLRTAAPVFQPSGFKNESPLLLLPPNVFEYLLEYLTLDDITNFRTLNPLAKLRIDIASSSHFQERFNYPSDASEEEKMNGQQFYHRMMIFRAAQSLETANFWDLSSFDILKRLPADPEQLADSFDVTEESLFAFTAGLFDIFSPPENAHFIQYLVSNTNLHLNLARLSSGVSSSTTNLVFAVLLSMLSSSATDAPLWTAQLRNAGMQYALAARRGSTCELSAFQLMPFIEYSHFIDPANTLIGIDDMSNELLHQYELIEAEDEESELREAAENLLAGVWHFVSYVNTVQPEMAMKPRYGYLDVQSEDIKFVSVKEASKKPGQEISEIGEDEEEYDEFAGDNEMYEIHFSGVGRFLSDAGNVATMKFEAQIKAGSADSAAIMIDVPAAGLTFIGKPFRLGYSGVCYPWNDQSEEDQGPRASGPFMMWKNTSPFAEANAEVEFNAFKALQEEGGAVQRRWKANLETLPLDTPEGDLYDILIEHTYVLTSISARMASLAFSRPYRFIQTEAEKVLEDVPDEAKYIKSIKGKCVPRGKYELNEIYEVRRAAFALLMEETVGQVNSNLTRCMASPTYFQDICTIFRTLIDFYNDILRDSKRVNSLVGEEAILVQQRLDDFEIVYGGNIKDSALTFKEMTTKLETALSHFTKLTHSEPTVDQVDEACGLLVTALSSPLQNLDVMLRTNLLQIGPAADRLVTHILGDDHTLFAETAAVVASSSDSEETSTIAQRIVSKMEEEDKASEIAKVYRKWSRRFCHIRPSIAHGFPPMTLELLAAYLSFGLNFANNDTREDTEAETETETGARAKKASKSKKRSSAGDEAPIVRTRKSRSVQSSGPSFAVVSAIVTGILAAGLGAFALGRIYSKPKN